MKHIIKTSIILVAVTALSMNIFAATPLYKPVKLPKIPTITLPHYDFTYAVEQYLKEHPLDIN